MNLHRGSLIRLRLDRKTVFRAEIQLDPLVDIAYPDAGSALGCHVRRIGKEALDLFLRHAKPIVPHLQIQLFFLLPGAHEDLAVAVHIFHAMVDRILHQRLQHQF